MELSPKLITEPIARFSSAAENALEVLRFGGLETGEESSPYDVVAEEVTYRLRRYFPDDLDPATVPSVLLVPPLMLAADVYDVAPATSAVAILRENGVQPWVVDFGSPEKEEGGLERTLADHVVAVSDAVERVREAAGTDVNLAGYSQGGMFAYQTAAFRRTEGVASLITFGSPVDIRGGIPLGIPEGVAAQAAEVLAAVFGQFAVPAWMSRTGFRMLDPVKSMRQRLEFLRQLHDREALLPRERQRRFLLGEGWVAWPGPALADFMRQFVAHNRMLAGGFVIEDRLVTLADIECPVLSFVGEVDEIAPADGVRAIERAAPKAEVYEVALHAGHFGLVVGSSAALTTWPTVAGWARWRAGDGELPENVVRPGEEREFALEVRSPARTDRLGLAAGAGAGLARGLTEAASRTVRAAVQLSREASDQLPRLVRLQRMSANTRVSLGLILDEQARQDPEKDFFLFEDRAYDRAAVNRRIDNVVRGLISLGVRQGEHVGVLMGTRPSALAVVAALSRLGAVAVLLRPDGEPAREVELGEADRIVADPDNAALASELGLGAVHTFVLGGGGEERDLGLDLVDMERIDPDEVELPAWYVPNPGRADDLAFVVFTGQGERTHASRISNGRWALSAFGTASSAALTAADTVYGVTPIHHPSSLLMTIGGAIAGGTRLAMASRFEPATFWDEVRRYGVTVATYTWTLLHDLVEAPPDERERHHPIRLFIGSGMPRGLWRRVEKRFGPARVVEFYASTQGGAILVNLGRSKPGAMGRPLPGGAELRIADYDIEEGRLRVQANGLARECAAGEVGLLLARADAALTATPLRGVFEPNDAWLATDDLFRRDEDGDYWLVDHLHALVRTADGVVATRPIADALADLRAIDLAVVYGVPAGEAEVPVAAVTLRRGRRLSAGELTDALATLSPDQRPSVVHVVDEIPVSTWYRPLTAPLRDRGLPEPNGDAWRYDRRKKTYVKLTAAGREKLAA
ncbi:MAG TPA: AMP-binding protein [Solirubrobacterales bacterium]|nr:AMP-binding protein [Solirubrobacterales bacterium]